MPIEASWEVDVWGRIRRNVESSEASAQGSAADLEATRLSLQATLASDYFQLRALDAQAGSSTRRSRRSSSSLAAHAEPQAYGDRVAADVAQAETLLESTRAQAIDLALSPRAARARDRRAGRDAAGDFSLAAAAARRDAAAIPVGPPVGAARAASRRRHAERDAAAGERPDRRRQGGVLPDDLAGAHRAASEHGSSRLAHVAEPRLVARPVGHRDGLRRRQARRAHRAGARRLRRARRGLSEGGSGGVPERRGRACSATSPRRRAAAPDERGGGSARVRPADDRPLQGRT
jgi:hypothetical protein